MVAGQSTTANLRRDMGPHGAITAQVFCLRACLVIGCEFTALEISLRRHVVADHKVDPWRRFSIPRCCTPRSAIQSTGRLERRCCLALRRLGIPSTRGRLIVT